MARKGQTEPNYAGMDGPTGRPSRWLTVSFNLFYPALISGVVLLIVSRFIHLPLGAELSAYLDHMVGSIERTLQAIMQFVL